VILVLCGVGCAEPPATDVPEPTPSTAASAGEAMRPLRPRPPEAEAELEPAAAPAVVSGVVIASEYRIGWHRMPSTRVVDGPWDVLGAATEPGDETVTALGRELEGCRTTELDGGRTTWCPRVGVVSRRASERGGAVDEVLLAARVGDATWTEWPCAVVQLVDEDVVPSLCERPIRRFGSGPSRRQRDACRWRYTLDGPRPEGGRRADVSVRLSRDRSELEDWAHADPGADFVDARGYRAWIVGAESWSAAARIRTDACGETDGRRLVERLVELAPD